MFRHLRNRLIFINLAVTTLVLTLSFGSIYAVAHSAAEQRKTIATNIVIPGYTQVVLQSINEQMELERRESLRTLLTSLVIVGLLEELVVAVLSYVMAEEAIRPVREAYEAQRMFIANASHEMKTPIAAIMANLEVADIQDNPWIDNVSHEVKSLASLNQELLMLARAENAMAAAKTSESVVLRKFVEELVAPFESRLKQQKVKFKFKTQLKDGKVKLVKNDFKQIFGILMDNAIKYCDRQITLTLTSKTLSLENDGAKISEQDLPRIFDRFYQTDKSSEGVGLGLAIAKTVAEREGWKLTATSDGKTTKFSLEF